MMAAKSTSTPSALDEIFSEIDNAQTDAADLSFLIGSALREFDKDPQLAFALLRSINFLSDKMFDHIGKAYELSKALGKQGGDTA